MIIQPHAVNQGDVFNVLQALVNRVLGNPLLAKATTGTRFKNTNAVYYSIAGILYTLAATDGHGAVTGLTDTGATQYRKVRIEIDSDGTVSWKEGAAAAAQALAPVPRRSASKATLGWIEIPASFTYGTSEFDASGVAFKQGDPDLGAGFGVPPNDRGISQAILTG